MNCVQIESVYVTGFEHMKKKTQNDYHGNQQKSHKGDM